MNIKNRIERLERERSDTQQRRDWNFEKLSTEDLIELINLIDRDPVEAEALKQRLLSEGLLKYEH